MRSGLGSARYIGSGQGGLRDGIGEPGKWPVNRDRPGGSWKVERAGKALFWYPADARRGLKVIAACGSSGW